MKKLMFSFLILTALASSSLQSMLPLSKYFSNGYPKEPLRDGLALLPPDLRREIVGLSLQAELGCTYKFFKRIAVGKCSAAAFSSDGKALLTGHPDNRVYLWSVETGEKLKEFIGHTDAVTSVTFSPDDKTVLIGSGDGTARLWDVETGKELQQFTGLKIALNQ